MIDNPATRPVVTVEAGRHKRFVGGHPWLYSNEIRMDSATKALPPGSVVTLKAAGGTVLGVASFNPHTLVSARLLDRDAATTIGRDFLTARFENALALRRRLYDAPYYRLVHAEADGLPGLIVDRFGDVAVAQLNTAGMELLENDVLAALVATLGVKAVVLRNDSAARTLEGLGLEVKTAFGAIDGRTELIENGARFVIDAPGGQKTGWFYDQRDNRAFMAQFASGGRMLDAYCFAGGFAIAAARAGAEAVVALDRSETALALAAASADLNGVSERCRFLRGDVFDELERLQRAGEKFDVVIADPPAFVKSKKDLAPGLRGYRKLTRLAAALVRKGGMLFVASCSHNVDVESFAEAVRRGLVDAGRSGRLLRSAGAAPDHPVHPWLPESAYLKAQVLALD